MEQFHGTTIVCVRRGNTVTMGGDGQVTLGNVVFKATARKVRRIYHDRILVGFAGATADAFTLVERFEGELEKHSGNLMRAAVELAKLWRTDRMLRHLEAMMIVADKDATLVLSGNGDVIEPGRRHRCDWFGWQLCSVGGACFEGTYRNGCAFHRQGGLGYRR